MSSSPASALGVDLAADPANTGAALLWADSEGVDVEIVSRRLDDDALVALARQAYVVGVDAPLGWPDPFVDALAAHRDRQPWPAAEDPMAQRRLLSKRLTDRVVKESTGLDPLSVAADRIAAVAMRAARLQTLWAEAWGALEDRAGAGRLVETYPAAALKLWSLGHRGYKAKAGTEVRRELFAALVAGAPWLSLDSAAESCLTSDHCFDAVVTALVALAAKAGITRTPTIQERDLASREGWIHLPSCPLDELGARLRSMV